MSSLHWQPSKSSADHSPSPSSPGGNIWFGVSLGLIGLVVGYSVGAWRGGSTPVLGNQLQPPSSVPAEQQQPEPSEPLPTVDLATEHVRGSKSAKVAVVEYSDFQCPFCKSVHPTLQQLLQDYDGDVAWVYRHYPLSFHPNAQKLAEGAECVAEQKGNDGFWKYADAVYGSMDVNADAAAVEAAIVKTAGDIGVNASQFKSCLSSGKFAEKIRQEQAAGTAAGVQGTPGNFVVNLETTEAREVSGALPIANFKAAVDALLP